MFQDMNVAKSAPSALLTIYQQSVYPPPKVVKKAPVLANYTKFTDHFSIWTTRTGNLKFYSKLHEICSIRQPPQRIMRNPHDSR